MAISTTISVTFFASMMASAALVIWQAIQQNRLKIRPLFVEPAPLKHAGLVTVKILSKRGYVAAPLPDFCNPAHAAFAFGPYMASPAISHSRSARLTDGIVTGPLTMKTAVKAGTQWHRPYLPRAIAARPDYRYRFQPHVARKLPALLAAVA